MKIIYLNHTPWDWILQRSQILELELEKEFDCTVLEKKYLFNNEYNIKKNKQPKRKINIPQLRGGGKIKIINLLNNRLLWNGIKRYSKDFDVVWICHPSFFKGISKNFKGKVIYDCMDNYVELAKAHERAFIEEEQKCLIKRADLIFASSQRLIDSIPGMKNAKLVRNGFLPEAPLDIKKNEIKLQYQIGYFGAIESWFDFDLLLASIYKYDNLEYHLIGPEKKVVKDYFNEKIFLEGIVAHDDLKEFVQDYDALIMPFIINDIILAVDPVKLYEYICYGKCVISIWYPEIERFSPYVYFYHDEKEYLDLLSYLIKTGFAPKYNDEQRKQFLIENSWEERGNRVIQAVRMLN